MNDVAKLPPGPRGTWRPTLKLIRNPRSALEGWAGRYGDPFFLRALNGPVVVTGREDLIREIHAQDPDLFAVFASRTVGAMLGRGSIFVLEGAEHRRERKLVTPMFHGDRMKAYGPAMQEITLRHLEPCQVSQSIPALRLMTDVSLEVIVRTIFGSDDPQSTREMMAASKRVVARANPLLFFTPRSHFSCFGLSPLDRWQSARRELERLFDDRARLAANRPGREDVLSLLCSARDEAGQPLSREHIAAELMTFLFAGHETTALTLTWALYHLHRHPETLRKLHQELDSLPDHSPASLAGAPWLKAVIQETLRVHPIVTETLRKLKAPIRLGEFDLPEGMGIAIATVLAHYNPRTWENPEKFDPSRFVDRAWSPFVYMPFGGGHRRCLGAAFASYEMAIVLGTMLGRYRFELVDDRPVVPKRRSVTMGPSSDVPLRFLGRREPGT